MKQIKRRKTCDSHGFLSQDDCSCITGNRIRSYLNSTICFCSRGFLYKELEFCWNKDVKRYEQSYYKVPQTLLEIQEKRKRWSRLKKRQSSNDLSVEEHRPIQLPEKESEFAVAVSRHVSVSLQPVLHSIPSLYFFYSKQSKRIPWKVTIFWEQEKFANIFTSWIKGCREWGSKSAPFTAGYKTSGDEESSEEGTQQSLFYTEYLSAYVFDWRSTTRAA